MREKKRKQGKTVDTSGVSLRYTLDSQFWEALAGELKKRNEEQLPALFESLSLCARALELPVAFGGTKSEGWALVCRMFMFYNDRMPPLGRREFLAMKAGTGRVVNSRFATACIKRIIANIAYPSSPDRSILDSLADTFLVNGLKPTEGYTGKSMDETIITKSLSDEEMMDLARIVVNPPADLWEEVRVSYGPRRPGFITRKYLDFRSWVLGR